VQVYLDAFDTASSGGKILVSLVFPSSSPFAGYAVNGRYVSQSQDLYSNTEILGGEGNRVLARQLLLCRLMLSSATVDFYANATKY
jgi:hypothetical protein